MARLLVLAHDQFTPTGAKTGHALIRYAVNGWSGDDVVAVLDRAHSGRDAGDVAGAHARGIPILGSVADALRLAPDVLAIGIAPVGGDLPAAWRRDVEDALEAGLDVVSGLHAFLGDDPALAALAEAHGATIRDTRRPRAAKRIATGEGALVDAVVVTAVGSDCGTGKMSAAIEVVREARARGIDAGFVATGQTGIMVGSDAGAPIDATVSDFTAGTVEALVLESAAKGRDLIVVEGQGSITHPAYSGVTASILHGSFPDLLLLCHEPTRPHHKFPSAYPFPVNDLTVEKRLNEALAVHTGAEVAAVSLITRDLDAAGHDAAIADAMKATGVPVSDIYRDGAGPLLDGILAAAERQGLWRDGAYVGRKRERAKGPS